MLIIPDKIEIQLTNLKGEKLYLKDVLVCIKINAALKNNIELSPFKSDEKGKIIINKNEILAKIEGVFDNGLMDYASIETASHEVEIKIIDQSAIFERIIYISNKLETINRNKEYFKKTARNEDLNMLLNGVEKSNKELIELLKLYEISFNKKLSLDCSTIYDNWNKDQIVNYSLVINY
jgi:hypothetical protein